MTGVIRIAIIDDHPLLLEGITNALRREKGFQIVATGASLADAVNVAATKSPDIILLDVGIPGGGIEAARQIAQLVPDIKLMMFTASERPDSVNAALEAGAMGYVLKGASSRELSESIRSVCSGKRYITPELAMMIIAPQIQINRPESESTTTAGSEPDPRQFTSREIDVIRLLSSGKTNRQIATELALSEKTVKHHMSNIMEKLQVKNRLEAALALAKWANSHNQKNNGP